MSFCLYSVVSSCGTQTHPGALFQSLITFFSGPGGCFPLVLQLPGPAVLLASRLNIPYLTIQHKHQHCSDWIEDDRTDCWPGFGSWWIHIVMWGKKKKKTLNFAPVQFCSASIFPFNIRLWDLTLLNHAWGNAVAGFIQHELIFVAPSDVFTSRAAAHAKKLR